METFVGDIVTIILETFADLTGYTRYIKYRKPDGTKGIWLASIDPLDSSRLYYTTSLTDLDQVGIWKVQAYATDAGYNCHGRVVDLFVKDMLKDSITTAAPTTAAP